MAWIRTPDRSVMVSENVSVGVAAYRSAAAPVQPKMRSAIVSCCLPAPARAARRLSRNVGQRGAGLGAAVEALPAQPQLADQRVALVDRDQEDLVTLLGAVHEDGLDVGGQRASSGWAAASRSQAARSSSHSVAPPGLG